MKELAELWADLLEHFWTASDSLDVWEFEEMATKRGLMKEEPYNVAVHGERDFGGDEGDIIHVLTTRGRLVKP